MQKLTTKQQAFVSFYLECWNETEAARRAGYAQPNNNAHRLMVQDGIKAAIAARLAALKMSADEVLTRLTEHARGSIAPFLVTNDQGVPTGFNLSPDRPLSLVKKVSITDKGISFEVYDAQAALALLGKHHGLFVERTEATVEWVDSTAESLDRKLLPSMAGDEATRVPDEPDQA